MIDDFDKKMSGSGSRFEKAVPLITIVTAAFNDCLNLQLTAKSIRSQNYKRIQWVVVDGGSKDGTIDFLRNNDDIVTDWITEPDAGIYDAFNKGCALSKGEWTLFLGAGDLLYDENSLARSAELLETSPANCNIAYGKVLLSDEFGNDFEVLNEPWEKIVGRWEGGRPLMPHHQGIFHSKNIINHASPYDINYKIAADSKLFYLSVLDNNPFFIDEIVARSPIGGVSSEPRHALRAAREILKINEELKFHGHKREQYWFYLKCAVKTTLSKYISARLSKLLIDIYRLGTGRKVKWIGK